MRRHGSREAGEAALAAAEGHAGAATGRAQAPAAASSWASDGLFKFHTAESRRFGPWLMELASVGGGSASGEEKAEKGVGGSAACAKVEAGMAVSPMAPACSSPSVAPACALPAVEISGSETELDVSESFGVVHCSRTSGHEIEFDEPERDEQSPAEDLHSVAISGSETSTRESEPIERLHSGAHEIDFDVWALRDVQSPAGGLHSVEISGSETSTRASEPIERLHSMDNRRERDDTQHGERTTPTGGAAMGVWDGV